MSWRQNQYRHRLTQKQERIMLIICGALIFTMLLLSSAGCTIAPTVQVTWETYASREEVKKICGEANIGCAKYNLEHKTCTIHTTLPVSNWILGHEVCHCFRGQTHAEFPNGAKLSTLSAGEKQTFNMCGL